MPQAKSKGQIEDLISKEVTKFYAKHLGVGPNESRVYIIGDMIIIRLKSRLLPLEEKLLEHDDGIALIKDIRKAVHEVTVGGLSEIIKNITQHNVISSHSDISTKTGEIFQVYVVDGEYETELKKQFV